MQHVTVSASRGTARVATGPVVPREALEAAVTAAGYRLGLDDRAWVTRDRRACS